VWSPGQEVGQIAEALVGGGVVVGGGAALAAVRGLLADLAELGRVQVSEGRWWPTEAGQALIRPGQRAPRIPEPAAPPEPPPAPQVADPPVAPPAVEEAAAHEPPPPLEGAPPVTAETDPGPVVDSALVSRPTDRPSPTSSPDTDRDTDTGTSEDSVAGSGMRSDGLGRRLLVAGWLLTAKRPTVPEGVPIVGVSGERIRQLLAELGSGVTLGERGSKRTSAGQLEVDRDAVARWAAAALGLTRPKGPPDVAALRRANGVLVEEARKARAEAAAALAAAEASDVRAQQDRAARIEAERQVRTALVTPVAELEERARGLQLQLDAAADRIRLLEEQAAMVGVLERENAELASALHGAEDQARDLQADLDSVRAREARARGELAELATALHAAEDRIRLLEGENAVLAGARQEAEDRARDLQLQLDSALVVAEERLRDLERQAARLEDLERPDPAPKAEPPPSRAVLPLRFCGACERLVVPEECEDAVREAEERLRSLERENVELASDLRSARLEAEQRGPLSDFRIQIPREDLEGALKSSRAREAALELALRESTARARAAEERAAQAEASLAAADGAELGRVRAALDAAAVPELGGDLGSRAAYAAGLLARVPA
jgi:predicted  nucleic acid-binding Zn-ribbon protein